ncbi:hypothetical protein AX774_g7892, partial [Zancudomyces culisetae]
MVLGKRGEIFVSYYRLSCRTREGLTQFIFNTEANIIVSREFEGEGEGQHKEIQQIQESNDEGEEQEDQEKNIIERWETSGEEDVEKSNIAKRGSKSKGEDYESDVEGNKRKKRLGIESSNRDNEGLNTSSARKGGRVDYFLMYKAKFLVREG